jgi:hypothetical protein
VLLGRLSSTQLLLFLASDYRRRRLAVSYDGTRSLVPEPVAPGHTAE